MPMQILSTTLGEIDVFANTADSIEIKEYMIKSKTKDGNQVTVNCDIRPIAPFDIFLWGPKYDEIVDEVKNCYPQIDWNFSEKNYITGKTIDYDFPIYHSFEERNTDLENGKDQLIYKYSFDVFTYYVDVAIQEMDMENQIATMQRRGGIFQGAGKIETIQVGFHEEIWNSNRSIRIGKIVNP